MLVSWQWSISVVVVVDADVGDMLTDFWFIRQPLTSQTKSVLVNGWKWWPEGVMNDIHVKIAHKKSNV